MTPEQMVKNEQIVAKIEQEIERLNASFAKYEQVKKFRLLATPFTIEAGELTPTLKLKRKAILKRYQSVIEGIYQ